MTRNGLFFCLALGTAFFIGRETGGQAAFAQDKPSACSSCKEAEHAKSADKATNADRAKDADRAVEARKIPSQSQPNNRPEDTPGGCTSQGDAGKLVVNTVFNGTPATDQVTLWVCAQSSPSGGNANVGASWRKIRLPILTPGT